MGFTRIWFRPKRQAIELVPELFSPQTGDSGSEADAEKQELYRQIGEMKVEMDFLKKTLGRVD